MKSPSSKSLRRIIALFSIATLMSTKASEPFTICAPDGTHTASANENGRIEYRESSDKSVKGTQLGVELTQISKYLIDPASGRPTANPETAPK